MRNKLLIPLIFVLLVAVVALHWAIKAKPGEKEIQSVSKFLSNAYWWQGKYPPDFELNLLNGEKFVLSEHIGKEVIVLNFFTTWCEPCKDELPELASYYVRHRGEGLILIGIDGDEKKDLVESFAANEKILYPVGIDEGGGIQEKFAVRSYPSTIFIGADGKIALYETGAIYNADVTFGDLYKTNLDILKKNQGISKEAYLEGYKNQPPPDTGVGYHPPEETVLEGRAKEFAARMRCPYTHLSTQDCHCFYCAELKRKLKAMTLEGMTDEQILKDLFLADTLKSDNPKSQTQNPK
jgi:thiol-disulfide isomerase/thioredoxin